MANLNGQIWGLTHIIKSQGQGQTSLAYLAPTDSDEKTTFETWMASSSLAKYVLTSSMVT